MLDNWISKNVLAEIEKLSRKFDDLEKSSFSRNTEIIATQRAILSNTLLHQPRSQPVFQKDSKIFIDLVQSVIAEKQATLLDKQRLFNIFQAIENVKNLKGNLLEVGVYRGGSTEFIARSAKELGLCDYKVFAIDTFVGHINNIDEHFDNYHKEGMFSDVDFESVQKYLAIFPEIVLLGLPFSPDIPEICRCDFIFAHIDTDLYQPTIDVLRFLKEGLLKNGIVIVDDYDAKKCSGIRKAIEHFLNECHDFIALNLNCEQVMLIKR